jgi:hypothetical protein
MRIKWINKVQARRRANFRNESDYNHVREVLEQYSEPICTPNGLVSISMVRDESDILETWLDHLTSQFSNSLIFDHCSTPLVSATLKQWCEENSRVYIRIDEPAYIQEAVFVACADYLSEVFLRSTPLIPLDADEFLSDKSARIILSYFEVEKIPLVIKWRNAFPAEFLEQDAKFKSRVPINVFRTKSLIGKTILTTDMVRSHGVRWLAGNHIVVNEQGYFIQMNQRTNAEILHIPLRSVRQLRGKILKGNRAYQSMIKFRPRRGMGYHWVEMDKVDDNSISAPSFVFNYGLQRKEKSNQRNSNEIIQTNLATYLRNF